MKNIKSSIFSIFILMFVSCESISQESFPKIGHFTGYYFPYGIIVEIDKNIEKEKIEKCKLDENHMIYTKCCCTHDWCHEVSCDRIKFNEDMTVDVELQSDDHPMVNDHVLWKNLENFRLSPSINDKCYVCANYYFLSCVIHLPRGQM